MTLPARAAALRGDDYQHAIAWYWACYMLAEPAICSVSVEDRDGGAFDDVVVRYGSGKSLYWQVKSSNYGRTVLDEDYLLTSTPNGRSPLQRFHRTWREVREREEENQFALVTNRGFDRQHPFLGELLDLYDERIVVERIPAEPRGAVAESCKKWAAHLGIDTVELLDFLSCLTLRTSGSESDWDERARAQMQLAGLRADDEALIVGKHLVRTWVKTGAGPQDRDSLKRQVAEKNLLARTGTLVFEVHGTDRSASNCTPNAKLDIVDLYSGDNSDARRILREHSDWNTKVQPSLAAKVRELEAYRTRRVHVTGHMRLPLWFAVGHALPDKRRWVLSLDQRDEEWSTASPETVSPRELSNTTIGSGPGIGVAIALTHDPTRDITEWAHKTNADIGQLLVLGPENEPGRGSVPSGEWAAGWARGARDHLLEAVKRSPTERLHLFFAAPAAAALMLGHQWNLLPPTTVYEHLPPKSYAETLTIP